MSIAEGPRTRMRDGVDRYDFVFFDWVWIGISTNCYGHSIYTSDQWGKALSLLREINANTPSKFNNLAIKIITAPLHPLPAMTD